MKYLYKIFGLVVIGLFLFWISSNAFGLDPLFDVQEDNSVDGVTVNSIDSTGSSMRFSVQQNPERDIDSFETTPESGRWDTSLSSGTYDSTIVDSDFKVTTTTNDSDDTNEFHMVRGIDKTFGTIETRVRPVIDNQSEIEFFRDVKGNSVDFDESWSSPTNDGWETRDWGEAVSEKAENGILSFVSSTSQSYIYMTCNSGCDADLVDQGRIIDIYHTVKIRFKTDITINNWGMRYVDDVGLKTGGFTGGISTLYDQWIDYEIDLTSLSVTGKITDFGFWITKNAASDAVTFSIDYIKLIGILDYATHDSNNGDTWDWQNSGEYWYSEENNVSDFNDGTTENWNSFNSSLTNNGSDYLQISNSKDYDFFSDILNDPVDFVEDQEDFTAAFWTPVNTDLDNGMLYWENSGDVNDDGYMFVNDHLDQTSQQTYNNFQFRAKYNDTPSGNRIVGRTKTGTAVTLKSFNVANADWTVYNFTIDNIHLYDSLGILVDDGSTDGYGIWVDWIKLTAESIDYFMYEESDGLDFADSYDYFTEEESMTHDFESDYATDQLSDTWDFEDTEVFSQSGAYYGASGGEFVAGDTDTDIWIITSSLNPDLDGATYNYISMIYSVDSATTLDEIRLYEEDFNSYHVVDATNRGTGDYNLGYSLTGYANWLDDQNDFSLRFIFTTTATHNISIDSLYFTPDYDWDDQNNAVVLHTDTSLVIDHDNAGASNLFAIEITGLSITAVTYDWLTILINNTGSTEINSLTVYDAGVNIVGVDGTNVVSNDLYLYNFDLDAFVDWSGTETTIRLEFLFTTSSENHEVSLDMIYLYDIELGDIEVFDSPTLKFEYQFVDHNNNLVGYMKEGVTYDIARSSSLSINSTLYDTIKIRLKEVNDIQWYIKANGGGSYQPLFGSTDYPLTSEFQTFTIDVSNDGDWTGVHTGIEIVTFDHDVSNFEGDEQIIIDYILILGNKTANRMVIDITDVSINTANYQWITFEGISYGKELDYVIVQAYQSSSFNTVCTLGTNWENGEYTLASCDLSLDGDWANTVTYLRIVIQSVTDFDPDDFILLNMIYLYDAWLGDLEGFTSKNAFDTQSYVDPAGYLTTGIMTSGSSNAWIRSSSALSIDTTVFDTAIVRIKASHDDITYQLTNQAISTSFMYPSTIGTSWSIKTVDLSVDSDWVGIQSILGIVFDEPDNFEGNERVWIDYIFFINSQEPEQKLTFGFWDTVDDVSYINMSYVQHNGSYFYIDFEMYDSNGFIASNSTSDYFLNAASDEYFIIHISFDVEKSSFLAVWYYQNGTTCFRFTYGYDTTDYSVPAFFSIPLLPYFFINTFVQYFGSSSLFLDYVDTKFYDTDWTQVGDASDSDWQTVGVNSWAVKKTIASETSTFRLHVPHLDAVKGALTIDLSDWSLHGSDHVTVEHYLYAVDRLTGEHDLIFYLGIDMQQPNQMTGFDGLNNLFFVDTAGANSYSSQLEFIYSTHRERSDIQLSLRSIPNMDDPSVGEFGLFNFSVSDWTDNAGQEFVIENSFYVVDTLGNGVLYAGVDNFDWESRFISFEDVYYHVALPTVNSTDSEGNHFIKNPIDWLLTTFGDWFQDVKGWIEEFVKDPLGFVRNLLQDVIDKIGELALGILNDILVAIGIIASAIWTALSPALSPLFNAIKGIANIIADTLNEFWIEGLKFFGVKDEADKVTAVIASVWFAFPDMIDGILSTLNFLYDVIDEVGFLLVPILWLFVFMISLKDQEDNIFGFMEDFAHNLNAQIIPTISIFGFYMDIKLYFFLIPATILIFVS